jgi:RNA polymerase sigma factor (sigma-70 family)
MGREAVQSDVELLHAARSGDAAAFDAFYRRHREVVLAYCAQRVRNPEPAADLMAEAFTAALTAVHDRSRPLPDVPVAWLFTIAHRKLIDSHRRGRVEDEARRRLELEPLVLDDADIERIEEIAFRTDVATELARKLPPDQLEALRARVLEERAYPEIAEELRCSEAVVRKRVSRALKTLRTSIGETT